MYVHTVLQISGTVAAVSGQYRTGTGTQMAKLTNKKPPVQQLVQKPCSVTRQLLVFVPPSAKTSSRGHLVEA